LNVLQQFEPVLLLSGHEQWPRSLSFAVDGILFFMFINFLKVLSQYFQKVYFLFFFNLKLLIL